MPKFKAEYLFNKIYDFDGVKEIEAKDIKEAITIYTWLKTVVRTKT